VPAASRAVTVKAGAAPAVISESDSPDALDVADDAHAPQASVFT